MKIEMTSKDVIDLYVKLEHLGIEVWIDGGWSTDALLGHQLRLHKDLDIAINQKDVPELLKFFTENGYKEVRRDNEYNVVFRNDEGKEIDYHAFITKGGEVVGGIEYPTESLTGVGDIDGVGVRCISPEWMVKFLALWVHKWPDKYKPAISALCEKFNIDLPEEYTRLSVE